MYDRKTWIILALCGVLIALNMHFASQNEAFKRANQPVETAPVSPEAPASPSAPAPGLSAETPIPPASEETVVLENDDVAFTLSSLGAGIKTAELKRQKNVNATGNVRINKNSPGPIGGLFGAGENLENQPYSFKPDLSEAGKTAVFIAKLPTGIIVKKTFALEEKSIPAQNYFLNLKIELENTTAANFDISQYGLFLGSAAPLHSKERPDLTGFFWHKAGEMHFKAGTSFKGGMISDEKLIIASPADQKIDYAGVSDQFFTTVVRPEKPAITRVWGKPTSIMLSGSSKAFTAVRAGIALPTESLAPSAITSLDYRIYTGPKANTMLRKLDNEGTAGKGWGDIMDYGFFWFVSRPLNWLLNNLHNVLGHLSTAQSWGLAIIFLTIIVRIFIWPLHAKSTHTMKRMSKLQPIMKELKEKYPDDPTKMNTEMMGLYRKYGINPLGGCLPMFLQIPIFFGFFKMLNSAVELRDQPFLWVNDLSQPDTIGYVMGIPINLLPIVMAATSAIQMAMMPKTGDKMQQRIMLFMPLMFFFFCYNYAAALALYWTTQNIFSIGQTYLMNKIPEPELVARKDGGKKSWMQRMAEKQADMQKNQQKLKKAGNMRDVTPEKPKKKGPPRTGG